MKLGQETATGLQKTVSNLSDIESTATTSSFANGPLSRLFGSKPAVTPTLTGTIEFATIRTSPALPRNDRRVTTTASSPTATVDYLASSYKMIDLGTAVAVHEEEDMIPAETMKTVTEMAFAG